MRFKEYFTKGKNYFIALIIVTALRAFALLFALYPRIGLFDPISIINLVIAAYAGYKLKLKIKESIILGALMFLSIIWYLPLVIPAVVFMSGFINIILVLLTSTLINAAIYSGAVVLGRLINRKQ